MAPPQHHVRVTKDQYKQNLETWLTIKREHREWAEKRYSKKPGFDDYLQALDDEIERIEEKINEFYEDEDVEGPAMGKPRYIGYSRNKAIPRTKKAKSKSKAKAKGKTVGKK